MNEATINTIDIPTDSLPNQEQVSITENALYVEMSDDEFAQAAKQQMDEAIRDMNKLKIKERSQKNYEYWVGDQIDKGKVRDDLEKGADNVIFRNIETFLPIVTSRTPEFIVTPTYKNEKTRKYAGDVKRMASSEWEITQKMRKLTSRGVRNHMMNFAAVFQKGYDPDTGTCWTEEILATDVVVNRRGDFLARYIKDETLGDIIEKFPDKEAKIKESLGLSPNLSIPKSLLSSPYEYVEIWTPKMVGWKMGDVVLDKTKNPHFDYNGREIQTEDGRLVKVKYNHFTHPKIPFIFLSYFNRGTHVFDDTSLIEQAIGPQDWINKRKRQIGANADSTNGHWVSSGSYISKEEFNKIEGGVDERIWLAEGKPLEGIAKITGPALPDFIYLDLQDSRNAADNVMGTHSTTRGEKSGMDTATQDIMAKDQDYGRIDGYIRDGFETFAQEWAEWEYHLKLVYGIEDQSIAIQENDDFESDNIIFSRDRVPLVGKKNGDVVPVPLVFGVKQGSTLPQDEVSTYARAKEMKDVLAPIDYFKMIGMPNPKELTKNFLLWQTDPYSFFQDDPEVMAALQRKQQQEMMAAQAEAAANGQMAPGAAPGGGMPMAQDPNGDSAEGTAKALRAIVQESGMDPAQLVNA